MTDRSSAAIAGSLVGLKQVGTHKSVVLSIHVPEELATEVVRLFGWPTGASPVPVVVFRPAEGLQERLTASLAQEQLPAPKASPEPPVSRPEAIKRERIKGLPPLKPVQLPAYIGMLCGDHDFQAFAGCPAYNRTPRERAEWTASWVRGQCAVKSRRDIIESPAAYDRWRRLHVRYEEWLADREPTRPYSEDGVGAGP